MPDRGGRGSKGGTEMQRLHQALKLQGKPKLQRELSAEGSLPGSEPPAQLWGTPDTQVLCFIAVTSLIHDNGCGRLGLRAQLGAVKPPIC